MHLTFLSSHCVVTLWLWVWIQPISSLHVPYPTYMHGPLCLLLATLHLSSPQDTCGPSSPPHMAYCPAGHLVRTPHSLSVQSSCQDSMHCGAPSGLDILIGKWVTLGDHCLGLHMALWMSGTWSGHLCTSAQQCIWGTCGRLWCIFRVRCHNRKMGCHSSVTGRTGGGSDNREMYIRSLVSQRKPSYLFSIPTLTSFGLFLKICLRTSIIVTLEYTVLTCVKLFDHLLDPNEPLLSTGYLPHLHHPGWVIIASSASEYMVSPSVSLPFAKRAKHLKLNTSFCGSWGRSETSVKTIWTEQPAPSTQLAYSTSDWCQIE